MHCRRGVAVTARERSFNISPSAIFSIYVRGGGCAATTATNDSRAVIYWKHFSYFPPVAAAAKRTFARCASPYRRVTGGIIIIKKGRAVYNILLCRSPPFIALMDDVFLANPSPRAPMGT